MDSQSNEEDVYLRPRVASRLKGFKPRTYAGRLTDEQAERVRHLTSWSWLRDHVDKIKAAPVVMTRGRRRTRRGRFR